ncbi:hypothetical protein [Halomicrococcus gelatinilyticus]|uniref:hypothetical protein n=1 Tax=Halomicrococcus gelatinilyticus TaxID=1702103 RepID=UPI002E137109
MSDASDTPQTGDDQQAVAGETVAAQGGRPQAESISDIVARPTVKEQVKLLTAAFAVVGGGIGLAVVLLGVLGKPPLLTEDLAKQTGENGELAASLGTSFVNLTAALAIYTSPVVAAVTALGAGAYTGLTLDGSDKTAWVTAGLGSLAGTVALVVLTAVLASSQMKTTSDFGMNYTWFGTNVQFTPLVVDAVAVGGAVAFVGAASAYLVRRA